MSAANNHFAFAAKLAREAGEIMKEHFEIGKPTNSKEDHSPVTVADTTINSLVIERVQQTYPDHSVLGEEESSGEHNKAAYTWVVDPIDGTRPFSQGIATSVFSLALTENGKVILAVVYEPHFDRMYHAIKGEGAFMNNQAISVSGATSIDPGSEFSFESYHKPWKFALLEYFDKQSVRCCAIGSHVHQSMLVASGLLNFTIFGGTTAHDVATAALLITEAGGFAVDLDGNDQRYDQPVNGLIAGTPAIKDELIALVEKYKATA